MPIGLPEPMATIPRKNEEIEDIPKLQSWYRSNASSKLSTFNQYFGRPAVNPPPPIRNIWDIFQTLAEWAAPISPTVNSTTRPVYQIRTSAVEQRNLLIYVAYTLDLVDWEFGIVCKMDPEQVRTFFNHLSFKTHLQFIGSSSGIAYQE